MYLQALSTAVPQASFSQNECWEIFKDSPTRKRLDSKSTALIEKVLRGDSGIEKRHFALNRMPDLFELPAGALNQAFEIEAPKLAAASLRDALAQAGWEPETLDGLFICTCTGYLCPGISSHVAEQIGIRQDAFLQDLVGLGCGAAIPTLRAGANMLQGANGKRLRVAVIAVEICSAAFYLEDDPGVLISACIFSDGAAASLWSNESGPTGLSIHHFDTIHIPEDRELLRFLNSEGKLKNRLHRSIPGRASRAVQTLWERLEKQADTPRILAHSGGRDVLDVLEKCFPDQSFFASREVLRKYGNMSSPSVLFALEEQLSREASGGSDDSGNYWLVSFGAGFSAHSCRLSKAGES